MTIKASTMTTMKNSGLGSKRIGEGASSPLKDSCRPMPAIPPIGSPGRTSTSKGRWDLGRLVLGLDSSGKDSRPPWSHPASPGEAASGPSLNRHLRSHNIAT